MTSTIQFYIDQDYDEPDKFIPMNEKTRHLFAILGVEKATLEQINSIFGQFTLRIRDQDGIAYLPLEKQDNMLIWRDKQRGKFFAAENSPGGHFIGETISATNKTALQIKLTQRHLEAVKKYKNVNY